MAIYEERIDDPVASFYPKTKTATPTVQDEPEQTSLQKVWRFVEQYYPDYDHADEIIESDDLRKILDGEAKEGSCAKELYDDEYAEMECFWGDETDPEDLKTSTMAKIQSDYDNITCSIYEKAIEAFLEQQPKPTTTHCGYLFGSEAIRTADREGYSLDEIKEAIAVDGIEGEVKEITFGSIEEMIAYEQGLDDGDGWLKYRKEYQSNPS